MTPRDRNERQFSEDIDRLLRGEQSLEAQRDPDYEETLQFAQRLIDLKEEPRDEFAGQLRHKLVVELAAQDAQTEASGSWFVRLFSRPSLRLAVVSTVIVLAAVGLVWRAGLLSPMMPQFEDRGPDIMAVPDPAAPPEEADPRLTAEVDDPISMDAIPIAVPLTIVGHTARAVDYGETVNITIEFSNHGTDPLVITPFPPAVHIRDAATGEIVYTFEAGARGGALTPMESRDYKLQWNQEDESLVQVEPGRYMVDVAATELLFEEEEWATEVMTVAAFEIRRHASDSEDNAGTLIGE